MYSNLASGLLSVAASISMWAGIAFLLINWAFSPVFYIVAVVLQHLSDRIHIPECIKKDGFPVNVFYTGADGELVRYVPENET